MIKKNKNLDDILGISISDDSETKVSIDRLQPFQDHPFKLYSDNKMENMVESIKVNGVLIPLLVREINGNKYEIIAGHNRWEAAKQAGLNEIPVIIKDVDDETATVMMVDTNFNQREEILPSEKAFAYKMKLDAIKKQGKRTDLTSAHCVQKLQGETSREAIAESSGENRENIRRYVRLTMLIPELLERVDNAKLGFIPAVEVSYLTEEQQKNLDSLITLLNLKLTKQQASELKRMSSSQQLNEQSMRELLTKSKTKKFDVIKIPTEKFTRYLPEDIKMNLSEEKVNEIFVQAMQLWMSVYRE